MSISSLKAGKIIGEETSWSTSRSSLHKYLFMSALVHSYRHGEPLFDDDYFIADASGPKLVRLDKHLECFGAKPYGNLFHQVVIDEGDAEHVSLLKKCLNSYLGKLDSHVSDVVFGYAWKRHYDCGEFKQQIKDSSISIQARLLLNRSRSIALVNHQVPFGMQPKDLELLDVSNQRAIPYTPTEKENEYIGMLLDIFEHKDPSNYLEIENSTDFYFRNIRDLSSAISRLLSYKSYDDQGLFLREYRGVGYRGCPLEQKNRAT